MSIFSQTACAATEAPSLSDLHAVLGGVISGGQVLAPAPGHSPKDRGMAVRPAPDAPGGFVVHLFNEGDPLTAKDYIQGALGRRPLNAGSRATPFKRTNAPAKDPPTPFRKGFLPGPGYRHVATYPYVNEAGDVLYEVLRYEHDSERKTFRYRRPDGRGGWLFGVSPRRVPYRLNDRCKVAHTTLWVTEGEKDADRLASLGFVANTAASGEWTPEVVATFAGYDCLVLEDNDETGRKKAAEAAEALSRVALSVRIVRLPGLAQGGDVSDWLDAGNDTDALVDLAAATPPYAAVPLSQPLGVRDSGTAGAALVVDNLVQLAGASLPKREHVLKPILHCRSLAMIYAARGLGKTYAAHGIGYAVASGGSFLRWSAPKPRKVLIIDGEMPAELLQERTRTLMAGAERPLPAPDYLRVIAMDRQEIGVSLNLALPEHQERIEEQIGDAELLILDNISTLVSGGRENDADSWDTMQPWLLHLRRMGVSALLIAHAGRGENARGTSKREDVLDTVIQLRRPDDYEAEDGARFEVRITKGRGVFGDDAAAFEAKLEVREGADQWSAAVLTDLAFEAVLEATRAGRSVRDIAAELSISKSKVSRIQTAARAEGKL